MHDHESIFLTRRQRSYDSQRAELRPRSSKRPQSSSTTNTSSTRSSNRDYLLTRVSHLPPHVKAAMPSSKGEPTDPELRERIKEEVKAEEKGEWSHHPTKSLAGRTGKTLIDGPEQVVAKAAGQLGKRASWHEGMRLREAII